MAIDRFCTSIDISLQTLSASLYPDETLLQAQDGVGLYDGKEKSPDHFSGRLHLTSHRLIFVAASKPHRHSLALDLTHVHQTEYYAGFLKSSPKITLLLGEIETPKSTPSSSSLDLVSSNSALPTSNTPTPSGASAASAASAVGDGRTWVCRVCGMSNVSSIKCTLCGVTRDKLTTTTTTTYPAATSSSSSTSTSLSSSPALRSTTSRTDFSRTSLPPPIPPLPTSLLPPTFEPFTSSPNGRTTSEIALVEGRIPCPVCTFLNHHSMSRCELCDSPLPSRNKTSSSRRGSSSGSRPSTPDPLGQGRSPPNGQFVRLSFRSGGEREFYKMLKEALGRKAWDWQKTASPSARGGKKDGVSGEAGAGADNGERAVGGIDAIMKSFTLEASERDQSLESALKDLESLMAKAKDMIQLARSINERLAMNNNNNNNNNNASSTTAASVSETKAASSLATSSLASLGLVDVAVTPDMVSESQKYHEELAKELATLLNRSDALVRRKGVVGLDEVWCAWNRARGVALVSPKDFRLSTSYLPHYTTPRLSLLTLPSGLTILHTPRYSLPVFRRRVWELLDLKQGLSISSSSETDQVVSMEGLSTLEIAQADTNEGEGIGIGLIKELLEMVEAKGDVCRDQAEGGGAEVRWFRNYFVGALEEWDGTIC